MALPSHFRDSTPEKLVFNRTVTLRDTWARIEKTQRQYAQHWTPRDYSLTPNMLM